ncbi:MAG: VOC family protein [Verrucomicrobiota bacterium]
MNSNFHHIGVACRDLESETRRFAALGYTVEGPDFTDPIQGVSGRFLVGGGPRLELLIPLSTEGVLAPWLKTGAKLYHLAYLVPDFDGEMTRLRGQGAKVVVPPVPAVAFANRRITFLMLPNMMLVELIAQH